ncbi:MAG: tyrosine--tRNA ligase [Acidimicrobiales bacterium]
MAGSVGMPTPGLFADLGWRGLIHQATDPALAELFDAEELTTYIGFDPTSDSLTIGNLVGITLLVRLQRAGHRPIALAGGGTGLIGDPGGKSEERPLLTTEELAHNVAGIRAQLERFLDFGPGGAVLLDNSEWLGQLGLIDFLRDIGKHFTVNAMVAKDSVRSRFEEREQGISFTEFSYMLLQAYDFQHLYDTHGCRVQAGGSDQWGNITAGIDLIRRRRGALAYGFTHPLLTKGDGTKFGKSESGTVWLDPARTSPYSLYQFFVRTEDAVVGTYLRFFSFRTRDELSALEQAATAEPGKREAQRALARDVVSLVHGDAEAHRVEEASAVLFSESIAGLDEATLLDVLAEAPSSDVPAASIGEIEVLDLLVGAGLESSRGRARTTIEQGGAYLNNRKVESTDARLTAADLLHGRYAILRKGKAHQHLLRVR